MSDQTPGGRAIVICTDTPQDTRHLAQALGQDAEVQEFDETSKALVFVQSARNLDLIIVKLGMPQLDGFAVLERLNADRDARRIPVVLMIPTGETGSLQTAIERGAADIIETPVNPLLDVTRMRRLLELKRKTDLLESVARLDPGTGLPNRRQFNHMLGTEWRRSLRAGTSMAVLMIELDAISKDLPDAGKDDSALRQVSTIITDALTRPADLLAHGGADADFVVMLPNTNGPGAIDVAKRIRDQISNQASPDTVTLAGLSVCIGTVSTIPTARFNVENFADTALSLLRSSQAIGAGRIQGQTLSSN